MEGAYNVVKIHTPPHVVGYTIGDARVHERFGITVVGIKSPGKEFEYGSKELIMHRNDELIIMGKQDQIDRFARVYARLISRHIAGIRRCRAYLRSAKVRSRARQVRWISHRQ